ncbi:unnamed protein product [Ranitomeya imitator]|uniref:Uncharacterized protein n=1 Tax=Ranitomeya imitator TaxID=111125 RepID=A0ABN9M2V9_9NEOB|nr:unnamed protein product [Ranitomeya imitator]
MSVRFPETAAEQADQWIHRSEQAAVRRAAVRRAAVRVPGSLCRGLLVFSAMSEDREVFLRARGRTFTSFREDDEKEWKGPFFFIQGADPQFGLMKSWAIGQCDFGGDEWEEEIKLTEEAVEAINKMCPKPKFLALCGDLVHSMPGRR